MREPAPASTGTAPPVRASGSEWWRSAVVYQIYPRSFADSNGDGIGDIRGIIGKLDHLATLGVDVLWLSPIYRSPQDDNGYDISDYQDVDPGFGTLTDVEELIEQAHARDIRIVMDLVVNHTSDEHPWFVESRSATDGPKRDWYWWRPARPGHEPGSPGAEPTNWESFFSGPAWEYDETTGEYYLHLFSRKQPDLNWENPEVRQAVYDMMRWWLDKGVDGFRMDVIELLSKDVAEDGSLPDGPPLPHSELGAAHAFVANGPRLHEFLTEMRREVLDGRDLMTVGETPAASVADARRYTDPRGSGLSMVFTFEHMNLDTGPSGSKWDLAPLRLSDLTANLSAWQEGLAETGWNSLYWNNHDQPRVVSRWGDDGEHRVASAKSLGTALHLLRGTPYVYQGEELGMTNAGFTSLSDYRDLESRNWAADALERGTDEADVLHALAVKSRDNARTPVPWDASEHAGFTIGTPWLAVNPNHTEINAEAAVADPDSVFHHYRRLIGLRHSLDVVVHGDYRLLTPGDDQVFAYLRTLTGDGPRDRLLVAANLSGESATVTVDAGLLRGETLLSTHAEASVLAARGTGRLELSPWESVVVLTREE